MRCFRHILRSRGLHDGTLFGSNGAEGPSEIVVDRASQPTIEVRTMPMMTPRHQVERGSIKIICATTMPSSTRHTPALALVNAVARGVAMVPGPAHPRRDLLTEACIGSSRPRLNQWECPKSENGVDRAEAGTGVGTANRCSGRRSLGSTTPRAAYPPGCDEVRILGHLAVVRPPYWGFSHTDMCLGLSAVGGTTSRQIGQEPQGGFDDRRIEDV